ncbi:thiol-disulfide oxidoreductase DCC family protein [Palleronia sp. KMU-117]|uniref:thiol-disulfide oxidoreductase DCC family protein n=1 Tax=Palleronia sp. KMU-117 TaxID=3434108 RepID=UPI003D72430F
MAEIDVIFNNTCPICAREVGHYRRAAEDAGAPIGFHGLDDAAVAACGLDRDAAARRFHVWRDGELLSGVDAFVALWRELPRWRWLARVVSLPLVRPLAGVAYDRVAAPLLYAMHRRREARR